MPLLEGMISTGRFGEFVDSFVDKYNEEQEEKILWEAWLHKVFDKTSFAEFKEKARVNRETAAPTQFDLQETFNTSFQLLEGFSLRGGVDGTIQTAGDSGG